MKAFAGAIGVTTLTLLSLGARQADAACSPTFGVNTPSSGTTVTCSGSNAATYGNFTQNGLTINVQSGASVSSATGDTMALGANNVVNNSGTVDAAVAGAGAI